jgi:acyl-CoA reductase-like NAD-dependent aldehyde dehydrogenase
MKTVSMLIGSEARAGASTFTSLDPYRLEPWVEAPSASSKDVDEAVEAARAALEGPWGAMSGRERAALMHRLADRIEEHADRLARIESRDNGKLLRETSGQLAAIPEWFRYFAGLADKIEGSLPDTGKPNYFGYVLRRPIGVVAAILPWNSPLLLMAFKLAPALAAGCTMVAKPSEQTPASVLEFAPLLEEAGFPPGVLNTVCGESREVGEWLVAHEGVDKVAFTGSAPTGIAVAQSAAQHLAPSTLELGGKSANVVFEDADVDAAVNGLLAGIFAAAGQTCIAGSRGLIHESVYDEVKRQLVERAGSIVMGDPQAPETEMGPICFEGQRDKIRRSVDTAVANGASLVTGGGALDDDSLFYPATVLEGVAPGSELWEEEVFGPVLALRSFTSEQEVTDLANASKYGLAAGIWTNDLRRALRVADALDVGTVWINAYRTLGYAMPFGGHKQSGYGHENGADAIDEYLVKKAVWIETSGETRDPFTLG